jgi:molybdopterin/thiamine biosynthesis adenylyltransferase
MDYFDRQIRIDNWSQDRISGTTALCLGVGGLGSVVTMNLCRLGVGKIILIDKDVVDAHNLNRQLLFSVQDIGKPKAQAARENLMNIHNLCTEIEVYVFDILENWAQAVKLSKEATVIFNMIDHGDYFDMAAQSLAIARKIPLIQGGTFSQCLTIDFFIAKPCLLCGNDGMDSNIIDLIIPSKILQLDRLDMLPKNNNPIGQSNVYLCGMCGMMMTSILGQFLINDPEIKISHRVIFYVSTLESVKFDTEVNPNCKFCSCDSSEEKLDVEIVDENSISKEI